MPYAEIERFQIFFKTCLKGKQCFKIYSEGVDRYSYFAILLDFNKNILK